MNKTYFGEYLSNNKIEIPIIQRDYAQGRKGKEYLRRNFLASLKSALDGQSDGQVLKLDFIYGSKENQCLQPLDGQQRLTTLWLMHWYIALKSNNLDSASGILSHFTYETRLSSRMFCEHLCNPQNFQIFDSNIVSFIESRTWFYDNWKQDPTIQAMLRMLGGAEPGKGKEYIIDGIEKLFAENTEDDFREYWQKLTTPQCPIIFYQMPLEDFGLSDDLYIKMNARGKQLSPFENFKADLIGYIRKKRIETQDKRWEELLEVQDGLPLKIDTIWTNIFWKSQSCLHTIDEIYLSFFNRFFWNELFMKKTPDGKYILPLGRREINGQTVYSIEDYDPSYKYLDKDDCHRYIGIEPYMFFMGNEKERTIPLTTFENLENILDNYYKYDKDGGVIPDVLWMKDFNFIPKYANGEASEPEELNVIGLSQIHRIVFYAVCRYLREGPADKESLGRWMRVVWNMVSIQGEDGRSQIRSTLAMRRVMRCLEQVDDSHHVYECLGKITSTLSDDDDDDKSTQSAISDQWQEEIWKAQQILDENGNLREYKGLFPYHHWEDIIVAAENYSFFHGRIRFLFLNQNGKPEWSDFDAKWSNAQRYFNKDVKKNGGEENAVRDEFGNKLLKSLISKFRSSDFYNVLWWSHRTFNNKPSTWMYYLLNKQIAGHIDDLMKAEDITIENRKKPDSDNDIAETALFLLTTEQDGLLDFVVRKIPYSWIRDYHGHKAIFPSGEGVFLNASLRNDFLLNTQGIKLDDKYKIPNTDLLYMSDINFKYKDKNFQWYRSNFIYRMDDDNPDNYRVKDNTQTEETKRYYCFYAKDKSSEEIISELDKFSLM